MRSRSYLLQSSNVQLINLHFFSMLHIMDSSMNVVDVSYSTDKIPLHRAREFPPDVPP